MDYEFFHSLSADESRAYLNGFLEVEQQAMECLRPAASENGCQMDYSLQSLPNFLKWIVKSTRINHIPLPKDEPWWIRQAHPAGLAEFDDESKTLVLRSAYYLGECFARLPGLRWATGNIEYLYKNMPVIAGFQFDKEMPPLIVVENMFARIVGKAGPLAKIDSTIEVWKGFCPSARG